ncbi:Uma2 family endonuclease [Lusitaniella coriacea LEGE 07157]|uniref:Uma2 family endonuclease n=1 Tax=Lusitaniella coriacea LEGE 07157 TaxID=945747 RepID=A0A8J7AWF2_9CYAN|nr:Uma2 family endonuclease [Lusitaniella coriacea]MBE9114657.1 Uma2 family endonuclease [Lusitaniella coriacea LEGE 07157]
MSQTALNKPDILLPPTQDELPYDDGIPMETQRHKDQMEVLINALVPWLEQREDGYIGGNMFVYFSIEQVRNQDYRGPDFFAVLGVPKGERKSWVVWQEGKAPDVIIELLSPSTADRDKNEKKSIYQNQMRASEYFWFDPFNPEDWEGFLLEGGVYQPIAINAGGQRISRALELALVRWQGSFRGVEATWLRWATLEGELLLLPEERAEAAELRAENADRARQEAIPRLLGMGLTLEQVAEALGLTVEEVRSSSKSDNNRA